MDMNSQLMGINGVNFRRYRVLLMIQMPSSFSKMVGLSLIGSQMVTARKSTLQNLLISESFD